jgi:diguanylate cyclase (GGDEF)-like protein
MSASPVLVGVLAAALVALAAATARLHRARRELAGARQQAGTDPLTGLANRHRFADHLAACLRDRQPVSVAILDVDQLRHVNHHHGYATGDVVLIQIADRLTRLGTPVQATARLCGDEFALLIYGNLEQSLTVAGWAWQAITDRPIVVGGQPLPARASIGVAAWRPGMSTSQLLHHVDLAMHHAKAAGTGVCVQHSGSARRAGGCPPSLPGAGPAPPAALPDPHHH